MDRRERIPAHSTNAQLVAMRAALDAKQANIWTTLPAIASKFNPEKLTVEAQPTIQAQVQQPNGVWVDTTISACVDCPVLFPGGGGYTLTFPIKDGDEGLLVFASRCIDMWWQQGGVQKQAELRMHDLSDGFFIPSDGMSNKKVPPDTFADGVQLRSHDGKDVIQMSLALIKLGLNEGETQLVVDNTLKRVSVTAASGLWVNGVRVNVP